MIFNLEEFDGHCDHCDSRVEDEDVTLLLHRHHRGCWLCDRCLGEFFWVEGLSDG